MFQKTGKSLFKSPKLSNYSFFQNKTICQTFHCHRHHQQQQNKKENATHAPQKGPNNRLSFSQVYVCNYFTRFPWKPTSSHQTRKEASLRQTFRGAVFKSPSLSLFDRNRRCCSNLIILESTQPHRSHLSRALTSSR